jgi:hypothetical protein
MMNLPKVTAFERGVRSFVNKQWKGPQMRMFRDAVCRIAVSGAEAVRALVPKYPGRAEKLELVAQEVERLQKEP